MVVTWEILAIEPLSHADLLIETTDGRTVHVDPWSEYLTSGEPIPTVVIATHADYDPYDPEVVTALSNVDDSILAFEAIGTTDTERGTIPVAIGDSVSVDGIEVTTVPAHNESAGERVDEDGVPFTNRTKGTGRRRHVCYLTLLKPHPRSLAYADIRAASTIVAFASNCSLVSSNPVR